VGNTNLDAGGDGRIDQLRSLVKTATSHTAGLVVALLFALAMVIVLWRIAIVLGVSDDYAGAVLPTLAGVIAGVPFAVWLIRVSDAESRRREAAAAAAARAHEEETAARDRRREEEAAVARRSAILTVIDDELRRSAAEVCGDRAGPPRQLIMPFLPTDAWGALSASGELRWIEDPTLIAKIANAYHRIGTTNEIERAAFAFFNDPVTVSVTWMSAGATPGAKLLQALADQDRHTIAAIDDARAAIHMELHDDGSPYVGPCSSV